MKLNNNRGITLTSLVITVIVLIILATITVYGGSKLIKRANVESLKTNMLLIQAKAKASAEEVKFKIYNFDKNAEDYNTKVATVKSENLIGSPLTNELKEKIQSILGSEIETEEYYYLTLNQLKEMNIDIKASDGDYIIRYDIENITAEIYYINGYNYEGNTYYSLTDLQNVKE